MKITAEQVLNHNYPMSLAMCPNEEDGSFDGSCPCGHIYGDGFNVEFHCWRTGCSYGCKYSGIHVSGSIPVGTMLAIAFHIRDNNGWTDATDWEITVEST